MSNTKARHRVRTVLFAIMAGSLSGCADRERASLADALGASPGSRAVLPRSVQPIPRIEAMLACIRRTGALKSKVFSVGPFADSTGKINSVAIGATGAFMPQGGSAAYVTDAISKAGGAVISTYFGAPQKAVPTHYVVNGIYNSLDFAAPVQADLRIAGIGPTVSEGWAQLSLTIQLDEADTRLNRQLSMIERPVRYSQMGVGVGHDFRGTLVTGTAGLQNQERLQFEALNGPIALGVGDVLMKQFPDARAACRAEVADLLTESGEAAREIAIDVSKGAAIDARPPGDEPATH